MPPDRPNISMLCMHADYALYNNTQSLTTQKGPTLTMCLDQGAYNYIPLVFHMHYFQEDTTLPPSILLYPIVIPLGQNPDRNSAWTIGAESCPCCFWCGLFLILFRHPQVFAFGWSLNGSIFPWQVASYPLNSCLAYRHTMNSYRIVVNCMQRSIFLSDIATIINSKYL